MQEVQNLRNTEDFASESSYRIPEVQRLQLLTVVYENIGKMSIGHKHFFIEGQKSGQNMEHP